MLACAGAEKYATKKQCKKLSHSGNFFVRTGQQFVIAAVKIVEALSFAVASVFFCF